VITSTYDAYTVFGRKRAVERQGRFNRPELAAPLLPACLEDGSEDSGVNSGPHSPASESPLTGEGSPDDQVDIMYSMKYCPTLSNIKNINIIYYRKYSNTINHD
jgi:hypothetical protein